MAHANRDKETRSEDLLRRLLDGLIDDRTMFHVEYIKEPTYMDAAVYDVVRVSKRRKGVRQLTTMEWNEETEGL